MNHSWLIDKFSHMIHLNLMIFYTLWFFFEDMIYFFSRIIYAIWYFFESFSFHDILFFKNHSNLMKIYCLRFFLYLISLAKWIFLLLWYFKSIESFVNIDLSIQWFFYEKRYFRWYESFIIIDILSTVILFSILFF